MVLFLLKRADDLKTASAFILLAPLALIPGPGRSGILGSLILISQLGLVSWMRLGMYKRTSSFQLCLPIPGRDLFLVRMIGAMLTIWAPLSAAAILLFLVRGDGAQPLLQGAAVLTVAAALPLSVRLREIDISRRLSFALWSSAAAVGAGAWFVLPPQVHMALFVVLSAAIFLRAYLAAPETFELSPREAVDYHPHTARWGFHPPAWWPILQSTTPWFAIPAFFFGMFFSESIVLAIQYSFAGFQIGVICRGRTRWLHALPVSRRVLLWCTMATTVAPVLAGVAFGTWIYRLPFVPEFRARMGQNMRKIAPIDLFQHDTDVPLEFWRRSPGGNVPAIESPWGEIGQPVSQSILGVVFYNPYTATKANSRRFFDWQFGNATQAMYGRRLSLDEYLQIPEEHTPPYPLKNKMDILALATLSLWLLFGVSIRELSLSRHFGNTHLASYLVLAVVLPTVIWIFADASVLFSRFGRPVSGPLLQALFMRLTAVMPSNLLAFAAIAAAPPLLLYFFIEWQFANSENTGPILPARTLAQM